MVRIAVRFTITASDYVHPNIHGFGSGTGLSGVYNILDHYEHEQKRAVEYVSTMHKAMNGVENFPYYSPTHVLKEVSQDKLSR